MYTLTQHIYIYCTKTPIIRGYRQTDRQTDNDRQTFIRSVYTHTYTEQTDSMHIYRRQMLRHIHDTPMDMVHDILACIACITLRRRTILLHSQTLFPYVLLTEWRSTYENKRFQEHAAKHLLHKSKTYSPKTLIKIYVRFLYTLNHI